MSNPCIARKKLTKGQEALKSCFATLPEVPVFGPAHAELIGEAAADALVIHRLRKTFHVPSQEGDENRRRKAIEKMLAYDAAHTPLNWRLLGHEDRRVFLGAKAYIASALKGYKPTYKFTPPQNETYCSAKGDTSLLSKLRNLEQWVVAPDCFDYAFKIVWNNTSLRKIVKMHFRREFPWRTIQQRFVEEVPEGKHIGYHVMRRMFKALVTFVACDKISSVPKDNEIDREISLVGFWTMTVQLSIAADLKDTVRRNLGYDINTIADFHKTRIKDLHDATVDFSSASNSNWWEIVQELFADTKVISSIRASRTGLLEYDDNYYPLNMMAPMGCGYTFEIMTITLLAYARQFDASASVFGDDVVIRRDKANAFMQFCSNVGWVVNKTKSFVEGHFRESCGAFYNQTVGYIVSYDVAWPKGHYDLNIIINKIRRIIVAKQISSDLKKILLQLWIDLVRCRVVDFRYPSPELDGDMIDHELAGRELTLRELGSLSKSLGLKRWKGNRKAGTSQVNKWELVSHQLQRPVDWLRQGLRIHTTHRRLFKSEMRYAELVRLREPGMEAAVLRKTVTKAQNVCVHNQRYEQLTLFSLVTV